MGLFNIFKKKEVAVQKPKIFVVGQVGNTNQKLVQKDDKLFLQRQDFFGKRETQIKPVQETVKKTGEVQTTTQ
jgi:hypothetical protein